MRITFVVVSVLGLAFLTGSSHAGNLPNTAACRDYERYARSAGAAGTMVPLNRKYQACLRSARSGSRQKRRIDLRYQCPNGYYKYYVGKTWYCKESGAKALDSAMTIINILSLFAK